MQIKAPKPLPVDLHMPCYACEIEPASHVCRYHIGELSIQVCLCKACMKMDTDRLLKGTIGLQTLEGPLPDHDRIHEYAADL
jgi:hypothetical protein